ncbi:MAG: BNR-4 repeat-containing protein, partial [Alphaproteobacteria bacterium]
MARPAGTYRRPITIDHTKVTGSHSDYQLLLRIDGSDATALFADGKLRWDGKDAALTTSDGETIVPYVRHYAGKGIATDAVWTWYNDPRAVHCAAHGSGGVTYIGIQGADSDTAIVAHDHAAGTTTYRKIDVQGVDDHTNATVHVTGTGRILAATWAHGTNTCKLHQFGSTTGNIDATLTTTTISPTGMAMWGYPSFFNLSAGKSGPAERVVCLMYGSLSGHSLERDLWYTYSDDDGATWISPVRYATVGANQPYAKHVGDGSTKVHIAFTSGHPNNVTTNKLLHLVFESDAGTIKFYQSDGTEITASLPFDITTEATTAYDSTASNLTYGTDALNWVSGVELDGSGNPAICFGVYPGAARPINSVPFTDGRYVRALWNGSAFVLSEIARAGDNLPYSGSECAYYAGVCLKQGDPDTAYVSTNYNTRTASSTDGPHEIEEWTYSGGSWSKTATITSGSGKGSTAALDYEQFRPYYVRDAHANLKVVWCGGRYASFTDYETVIHTWPNALGTPLVYLTAKVPSVTSASDTTLYLYYGNRDASSDGAAAASSVLPSNCKLFIPGDDGDVNSATVKELANSWRPAKSGFRDPREVENGGGSKFFRAQKITTVGFLNNASFAGAVSNSAKDFTILAWVKFTDLGATYGRQTIFKNYESSAGILFRMRCYDGTASTAEGAGHRLQAYTVDSGGAVQGGEFFIGQTNMAVDTWYFVALTFSSSDNLLRCYLDGVAASETYSNPTWHATSSAAGS